MLYILRWRKRTADKCNKIISLWFKLKISLFFRFNFSDLVVFQIIVALYENVSSRLFAKQILIGCYLNELYYVSRPRRRSTSDESDIFPLVDSSTTTQRYSRYCYLLWNLIRLFSSAKRELFRRLSLSLLVGLFFFATQRWPWYSFYTHS